MSILHVSQIMGVLERMFRGHIDLSDVKDGTDSVRKNRFLTRSFSAFALHQVADVEPSVAAKAVTDGPDDNGLDAVYHDPNSHVLYIVQSKWREQGAGSLSVDEVNKVLNGFRDLVQSRFERFNSKIRGVQPMIEHALMDEKSTYKLILIHTGQADLAEHSQRLIDNCLEEFNDFKSDSSSDLLDVTVIRQKDIHDFITRGVQGGPVDLEISVEDWGKVDQPFAVYGQVQAADIADWWTKYYPRLVEQNIRKFLGADGEVNSGLQHTLLNEPERFWHHNNGITVICQQIERRAMGSANRNLAFIVCRGASTVNSAQTDGSISAAYNKNLSQVSKARVPVRFIEVGAAGSPDFGVSITRSTNTQNKINRQDFVSLDPEQDRIRRELALEGVTYHFKSGDMGLRNDTNFDLDEATVALACAHPDLSFSTTAKREAGRLWDQSGKSPYRALFNTSTSSAMLWRNVQIYRLIERLLDEKRNDFEGRDKGYAVHGSRFIAHHVFQALPKQVDTFEVLPPELQRQIAEVLDAILEATIAAGNDLFPAAYLAPLFNSPTRTAEISKRLKALRVG